MNSFLTQIRDALVNGWRNSRGADRLPYITILAGFAILLLFYFGWMMRPTWVFLMRMPDPAYAQRVTSYLDTQGIPYKIEADGVYVRSEDDKYRAQFALAESGAATGSGGFDWEIFIEPKLGMTSDVLRIQVQQAKRASIERRLAMSPNVEWAIVNIDVAEESLFDEKEPTASVTVKTIGRLTSQQVRAIQEIVASAQVGMDPVKVRVTDANLNLLSEPESPDPLYGASATQLAAIREYEETLEEKALAMLMPVVGDGKARVKVSLDLDFRDRSVKSTEVDPESTVVVSEEIETEETVSGAVGEAPGIPSNLPGEGFSTMANGNRTQTLKDKTRTEQDYSRSETVEREIGPKIRKLTASVLVDGIYTPGAGGGAPAFQARNPGELDELRSIVAAAVGLQADRDGENAITIACAPFQSVERPSAGVVPGIASWLSEPRKVLAPIVLILLPLVCLYAYRKIDLHRQTVRMGFRRDLEDMVQSLHTSVEKAKTPGLGEPDFMSLSGEDRKQAILQERLIDHAREHPKEFAQVIRSWMRESRP